MGKRGPRPKHDLGEGSISRSGYHRIYRGGVLVMAHRWAWEQANGPIPADHDIHHADGDRLNNDLGNLACVTKTEHKRIHGGCVKRDDGSWLKPCSVCGGLKPVGTADWYISKEGWPLYGRCRPCHIKIVVASKRLRRLREKEDRSNRR